MKNKNNVATGVEKVVKSLEYSFVDIALNNRLFEAFL